ncbi:hypothetical protein ACQP00_31035 [Dactylosporangium sp. CS-047395]|uniref:hypothetical protein n=1 Tax=Dactylosporangium sp. CS-047395 TaxID=3239936 RepID=UPI003D923D30
MNVRVLTDALLEEERHAPDAGLVMAHVRERVKRRRRTVQMASLALLVLVAWLLSPAQQQAAEGPAPGWTARIRMTWLPEGVPGEPYRAVGLAGEAADFGEQETGPYLQVALDSPANPDWAGWTATSVNGQRGRFQSSPLWTRVLWTLPSGRSAALEYGSIGNRVSTLERDALRAAAGLRDDGELVLRPKIEASYLPAGLSVAGVDSDGGISLRGDGTAAIRVVLAAPSTGNGLAGVGGPQRVRDVQGLAAYAEQNFLNVLDFHGHTLVLYRSGDPIPSLDEALRTADGVRWIGG